MERKKYLHVLCDALYTIVDWSYSRLYARPPACYYYYY